MTKKVESLHSRPIDNETKNVNVYSGSSTFLYSSKITGHVNLEETCEILAESDAFIFALTNRGKLCYTDDGRLKSKQLNIEAQIADQGITVNGHADFLKANPGNCNIYAFLRVLEHLLSEKRLFNAAYGFPTESARIFMRPIAIQYESDDTYEYIAPYIRIYEGGIISIALPSVLGFEDAPIEGVIYDEVNKSRQNITSMLCERELYLACAESQLSQMTRKERLKQRKAFESIMRNVLSDPHTVDFIDEPLTVYELIHTDQFTLTDVARNLLSVVARTIALGRVQTRVRWYANQYKDDSIGQHWRGKPIIYIKSHTDQKSGSLENWNAHRQLVNSILIRNVIGKDFTSNDLQLQDMRNSDDYNSFYTEQVSLMLASSNLNYLLEKRTDYTFDNLIADIQALNEASHYILTYYSYASLELEKCGTSNDVARIELDILNFEETLLSAHKYGEIAHYIENVLKGDHLTTIYNLMHKKMANTRKRLELDEKITSESYTRRITIIFGLIASATLSPELMQPLAKYLGIASEHEHINKLYGIAASIAVVAGSLTIIHYFFKISSLIKRYLNGHYNP